MLPQGWERMLRGAMERAGVAALPLPRRRRVADAIAARLQRYGVRPRQHNWGGVLCQRTEHRDCCVRAGGRRWQRFASDAEGLQRLVELCVMYTGARPVAGPVEGFRSELRSEGWFGPTEEAEKAFQDLSAAWAGLEADFGTTKLKTGLARDSYAVWVAFRDKWKAGNPDTTALSAMVAEVNMVRQNLGKPAVEIRPPEVTQSTGLLRGMDTADKAARAVTATASDMARDVASGTANAWAGAPLPAKIGAVAVAVLSVVAAILGVRR